MTANKKDPIPESFDSIEEAGQFWDTHSAADYWDEMEFDLQKRTFRAYRRCLALAKSVTWRFWTGNASHGLALR